MRCGVLEGAVSTVLGQSAGQIMWVGILWIQYIIEQKSAFVGYLYTHIFGLRVASFCQNKIGVWLWH